MGDFLAVRLATVALTSVYSHMPTIRLMSIYSHMPSPFAPIPFRGPVAVLSSRPDLTRNFLFISTGMC